MPEWIGFVQNVTLYSIAGCTFVLCRRRARR